MDRVQMIIHLLQEEERANAGYITGEINREQWINEIRSIDERLSVLGIRLTTRPWETVNSRVSAPTAAPSNF
jgi:predicted enzyme involved in methoxymalonyl-ACP biosynthesis